MAFTYFLAKTIANNLLSKTRPETKVSVFHYLGGFKAFILSVHFLFKSSMALYRENEFARCNERFEACALLDTFVHEGHKGVCVER